MKLRTLTLLATFLASAVAAEAGDRGVRDFRLVQETTPLLITSNPATPGFWSGRIAMVEAGARKGNGGLISLEQSPDDFTFGALTESYFRVSELITFHGKLSWSRFSGKEMGGQVMMRPEYHPVNFLESDETTVGKKNRELYQLTGGIALNLGPSWSIGISADYQAGDQTKVKDPRFSNILMDLDLKAGVAWRPSRNFVLGLTLQYQDLLEQVRGGIYGATDKQYFIQIDRGGFFGTTEELNGDYNTISASNYRPMDNRYLGASLQVILFDAFTSDFSFRKRDGYYGKKSTTTPVYYEFSGIEAGYDGVVLIPAGNSLHRTAVNLGYSKLANNENKFKYVTPTGGNTTIEYTAQNEVLARKDISASLDYRFMTGTDGIRPGFIIGARGAFFMRQQTTTIYPFWRQNSYNHVSGEIYSEKSFISGAMSYTAGLSAQFRTGWGVDKKDGSYVEGATSKLKSFDSYLNRQFEYDTASRAGGTISFTVARRFTDSLEGYVKLSDSYVRLLSAPQYLMGNFRNLASITIGCNF